jgi:hypothetical protein
MTFEATPAAMMPVAYTNRLLAPARLDDFGRYRHAYDDAWTPAPARPLWEPGLEPVPGARGYAVALWHQAADVRFGAFSLVADGELIWLASGAHVAPLVSGVEAHAATELRLTPLEHVTHEIEHALHDGTSLLERGLAVREIVTYVGGFEHRAAKAIDRAWAAYDAAATGVAAVRSEAVSKAEVLVKRLEGLTHAPADPKAYVDSLLMDGLPLDARVKAYEVRRLRALGAEADVETHIVPVFEAAERLRKAKAELAGVGRVADARSRLPLVESGDLGAYLKAFGLALSVGGVALVALARLLAARERERAELDLAGLLGETSNGWTREQHAIGSLLGLAIERSIAGAEARDEDAAYAYLGVAASLLGFTPLAPIGLGLDAIVTYGYYEHLRDELRPPKPPEELLERMAACATRLVQELLALYAVQSAHAEPGLAAVWRIAPSTSVDGVLRSVSRSERRFQHLLGLAKRAGADLTKKDVRLADGTWRAEVRGSAPTLEATLQRNVAFWLRRLCAYDLARAGFGEHDPADWQQRIAAVLWADDAPLGIKISGKTKELLIVSRGTKAIGFPVDRLSTMASEELGAGWGEDVEAHPTVATRGAAPPASWIPRHPATRALQERLSAGRAYGE